MPNGPLTLKASAARFHAMTADSPTHLAGSPAMPTHRPRIVAGAGWAYSFAIGLSACLLFTLEPMVGLRLLPLLGGAPSVWATALAFFQVVLLLGYLYAHVSVTRLGRLGPVVHLVLAGAAMAALLVAPATADLHFESLHPVVAVLATLTIAVGLPTFLLCSTTPLLSAWLTTVLSSWSGRSDAPGRADPYRLYVVSNAGSLLALLAYPLVVEPGIGLAAQRVVWAVFFGLLVASLAVAGFVRVWLSEPGRGLAAGAGRSTAESARERIAVRRVAVWLLLAAVPCGLLSAVTNFITADLVAAPLLWVGPLGIYLATFIVAFSARGRRTVAAATKLAPAMATLLWIPYLYPALWPTVPLLALELMGFGVVALTLHGRLAGDRPDPAHLTLFYLVMSAGGVVGGSFVGFLAPVIFPAIWEYPILLVAALAAVPIVAASAGTAAAAGAAARRQFNLRPLLTGARMRLIPFLVIGAACSLPIAISRPVEMVAVLPWLGVGAAVLLVGAQPKFLATTTGMVLAVIVLVQPLQPIYQVRDFFGVSEVTRDKTMTVLWHGTTTHGSQWVDADERQDPTGYYHRLGPLGDVMAVAQARGPQAIGVTGLGSGTIAAYERPSDHMTFLEIDPAVVRIAEDPSLFTYLSDAPNRPTIVVGDARLELRNVPDASYDLLILDAFSGDSIPTHLLSVEALRDDLRVLKPGGFLLIHVSNRYYDLAPAVVAGAQRLGLVTTSRRFDPTKTEADEGALASQWVVASVSPETIAPLAARGWTPIAAAAQPITDDFPDVLRFARFGSWLTSR
jgi:SAM-dependent methyltransferase